MSDGISQAEVVAAAPLQRLPYSFAAHFGVVLANEEQGPCIYYRKGITFQALAEIQRYVKEPFTTCFLGDAEFQKKLSDTYQKSSNEAVQAAEDIGADMDLDRLAEEIPEASDLMSEEDDAPVIRLINAILSQAVREKASDIHVETFEQNLVVRFRIDGVLSEVLRPKRMLAPLLVSRLKVMAKLDIAEKRIPQDGRISVRIAGHAIDIRMSTNPTAHGERIVLRLLDKQAGQLELEQLHMNEAILAGYKKLLAAPYGIILVTGPTGSGKTTTLYAGLSHINDASRNILTIEDPVEYLLPGIGQTQVNPKVEMTFARGLRAILRQDPDVVMVGEIRDRETAEIAVQASLTGHLVLSTLHTNTAAGAITRLNDMGIEPFLISSSLVAVMAQRLVRLLCPHCKQPAVATEAEKELLGHGSGELLLYRPAGCKLCNFHGYKGRAGIYEFIEIDENIRTLIHDRASEQKLVEYARQSFPSIRDNGFSLVRSGETTLEEILRVTSG